MADYQMIWLIAIFIASNRIFTEGICKLCDLIISDLIDEDFIENDREVRVVKAQPFLNQTAWSIT